MVLWLAALAAVVTALRPASAAGLLYRVTASVRLEAPQIQGTVTIDFTNPTAQPLDQIVLMLFPNRFATPDSAVNDVNRPYVYWQEEFRPGGMNVLDVQVDSQPAATRPRVQANVPAACALEVQLPTPLPPGAVTQLRVQFETLVPKRYGSFGVTDAMLTVLGGWYPYPAWLRPDGTWALETMPAAADFEVELSAAPELSLLLNGQYFPAQSPLIQTQVRDVHDLTLIAARGLVRDEIQAGATRVVFFDHPELLAHRVALGPSLRDIRLETLRKIVAERPAGVPQPEGEVVVVAAPLHWYLTAAGEGMVVISDRTLEVFHLLRPFHERRVAQAVYAELLRSQVTPRESPADYAWVREGLAHTLARRYLAQRHPEARSTQDWIELFNVFAIVDRFETAPQIPFAETLFDNVPESDPLHERLSTFNNDLPPGNVVLGKLRQQLGDEEFDAVIDRCRESGDALRACTARVSGEDLSGFYTQWLQAYPELDYSFGDVNFNAEEEADGFASQLEVRRAASRPIREPVDVAVHSIGGQSATVRWDGDGDTAQLRVVTPRRAYQAVIDPERQLIETTRADNAHPPILQIVFDSAEVEVSSTEFGFSGLVVARGRYDYRKDLAVAWFYTNRAVGVTVGPRFHWGEQNDANSYRNNFYGFYGIQALDSGFRDAQRPAVRTAGHLNSLSLRYEYNTILSYNNPTRSVRGRLFADWFDGALGSDYNYVDWGAGLAFTHPLWTDRTIFAGEIATGFSEPLGSSVVPNQGLFSLGGSRSIRGIGAEDELGRNIFLLRAELRQSLYPEVDLNLNDVLVVRRTQVHVFVDTGQVGNSAGGIYDPAGYAVGIGAGLTGVYDFMGFFPLTAYLELATELRGPGGAGGVQVLFGTRQPF